MSDDASYIELAADIVSAYVSNNSVAASDIPSLISQVHSALSRISGQPTEVLSEPLKPAIKSAVLDAVAARLESSYVDAGAVPAIVKALRERQGKHAYDAVTNPAQFAEMITQDLRSVNGDLHLGLRYSKDSAPPPGRGVAASVDAEASWTEALLLVLAVLAIFADWFVLRRTARATTRTARREPRGLPAS